MLRSLILPAILLASQAIALNVTYAYVPGFFAQDDPNADPEVIGAVRRAWLPKCFCDRRSIVASSFRIDSVCSIRVLGIGESLSSA